MFNVYSNIMYIIIHFIQGSYVQTQCGKSLLDFTTGIGVLNTGHSHPRIVAAAKEQLDKHSTFTSQYWLP